MAAPTITTPTMGTLPSSGASDDLSRKMKFADFDFEKVTHDAGVKVGAMASDLTHSASEYVETGRHYVVENPGKSLAIAAAAGMVAGGLITFAMSRRHE